MSEAVGMLKMLLADVIKLNRGASTNKEGQYLLIGGEVQDLIRDYIKDCRETDI